MISYTSIVNMKDPEVKGIEGGEVNDFFLLFNLVLTKLQDAFYRFLERNLSK